MRTAVAGRPAGLQDLWGAECAQGQRHRVPHVLWVPTPGQRADDRTGDGAGPFALLHCSTQPVRQRPVIVAQQYVNSLRPGQVPKNHVLRQHQMPAPPVDRAVWHRAHRPGLRVLHGCATDIPLGSNVSRYGGKDRTLVRVGAYFPAQLCFPGRSQSRTVRRRCLEQWLV